MPDEHHELFAMAKEQGRLAGLVEGVRDDVAEIKTEQSKMRDCMTDQCGQVKEIKGHLGQILKTMTESGIRPAVEIPPEPITVLSIIKNALTPITLVLIALILVIVILVAALTGRSANDLVPNTHPVDSQEKQ